MLHRGHKRGKLGDALVSLSKGKREPFLCCMKKLKEKHKGTKESSLIVS